jgi:hypothetical protein
MAKRSAKRAVVGNVSPGQRQHSMVWLQGLLCGALAMLAPPTALLMSVLLGPAILALVFDASRDGRGRAASRCSAWQRRSSRFARCG